MFSQRLVGDGVGVASVPRRGSGGSGSSRCRPWLRRWQALLAATAACLLPPMAQAEPADVVTLATGTGYPPFADEPLPGGGLTVTLVRGIYRQLQKDITIDVLPWKRGYEMARNSLYAGTFPYLRTATREADFFYSEPIYVSEARVFTRKGKEIDPRQEKAFHGKIYCRPLGYGAVAELAAPLADGSLSLEQPTDLAACVKMVAAGIADFYAVEKLAGQQVAERLGMWESQISTHPTPLSKISLHLIVSRSHPQAPRILADFNRGLKQLVSSGEYDRTIARYTTQIADAKP